MERTIYSVVKTLVKNKVIDPGGHLYIVFGKWSFILKYVLEISL